MDGSESLGTVYEDTLWRARQVKGQCDEIGRPRNRRGKQEEKEEENLRTFLTTEKFLGEIFR